PVCRSRTIRSRAARVATVTHAKNPERQRTAHKCASAGVMRSYRIACLSSSNAKAFPWPARSRAAGPGSEAAPFRRQEPARLVVRHAWRGQIEALVEKLGGAVGTMGFLKGE